MKQLTVKDIARSVGYTPVAIRHWCKWGIIPCERKRGRLFIEYPDTGLRIDSLWVVTPGHEKRHGWTRISKKERIALAQLLADRGIPLVTLSVQFGKKRIEVYRPDRIPVDQQESEEVKA